jgi:hypothetical protein
LNTALVSEELAGVALATVLAVLLPAGSGTAAERSATRDLTGVWWGTKYSPRLEIEGSAALPFNDAGKARYAQIVAGLRDGSIKDQARYVCVPDGIPRILGNPYPFKIVQSPGQTTFLYELNHAVRIVLMDVPQMAPLDLEISPYYLGHSVGHWEGDTLVIETAGFNEKTFLDATGAPHSDQLKTVERIRKINGGKQLETIVTITDPVYLTRAITAGYVYNARPDVQIATDYVCGEPHRDISQIPGVSEARRARAQ